MLHAGDTPLEQATATWSATGFTTSQEKESKTLP